MLAYQFRETDPDEPGSPSEQARLGAVFLAEQYLLERAFMLAWTKGGGK
ncbi:hypothetical protein ACFP81_10690 [Deinococcus lacus]|uniref:Uncharacterized protein n=1 Tax=Deinococcus lacus TaxID=392561 RepID=A0ABW1YH15_9DEIO